jgi:hypothetical protein
VLALPPALVQQAQAVEAGTVRAAGPGIVAGT